MCKHAAMFSIIIYKSVFTLKYSNAAIKRFVCSEENVLAGVGYSMDLFLFLNGLAAMTS